MPRKKKTEEIKSPYITDEEELSISSTEIDVKKDSQHMREVITKLKECITKDGLTALSAPQIGFKDRIFCVKFKSKAGKKIKEEIHTYVNPVITGIRGLVIDREGDISLGNKQFIIVRNNEVSIIYQTPLGKAMSQKFSGKSSAVIQFMIDHLDGILLSDTGLEIDERFDEATEEEKNELIEAYLESLDIYGKSLRNEIESNKELKSMDDAVKFIQSVRNGETDLGAPIEIDTSALQENK